MSVEEYENPLLVQQSFNDFCHLPNTLLRPFGINFNRKQGRKWWNTFKKCLLLMEILAHFYCLAFIIKLFIFMLLSDEVELSYVLRLLSGVNYSVFATLKFLVISINFKEYQKIYETLQEIYPKTLKEKLANRVRKHFWPKWILIILYFYVAAVALITWSPFVESVVFFAVQLFKVDFAEAQFPYGTLYDTDYGFDRHQPLNYLVTYAMEAMHAHFIITCNIVGEILLLCFCLQLCMHFDFLAWTLENYEPNGLATAKDQQFIADFVKKHQILLNVSSDLNRAFGALLLLLVMATTGTLCCAAVFCLTQGFGAEFLEYVAFLPTVVGQYFMICYYGQQLIIKSQNVADAAYNHPWYNGSNSYKKSIFIILMRSQKEAEINAYGFQSMCLEAFKMVMGVTYRSFAVLKETML